MNIRHRSFRAVVAVATAGCLLAGGAQSAGAAPLGAAPTGSRDPVQSVPQLETLDRGLVAVSTSEGVFLSWRLLASEAGGATASGLAGPDFAVYRDGERIATASGSTTYRDAGGSASAQYTVVPIVNGVELTASASVPVSAWADGHHDLPLQKPADGVTPKGEAYTYSANDVSVGDVDGDGQYEYVVKWDPSNSKDVSQRGYTGPVYLDTYELDGTLLNRLDLGVNIRAGAHYTQFLVYDFDGDGRSETMLKTAPGTKSVQYAADGSVADESYITLPKADRKAGYSNSDDYRLSADDYEQHLVEMFLGWSDREEVVSGQWPATLEEAWGMPVTHEYPLTQESAEQLADTFLDVYAPGRSDRNVLREFEGFVIDGPEYLTVFDSATGAELQTIPYPTERGDDGLLWGDYAMSRIEPANRVDRFLAGVGYLDGQHPSAVFARGYYTRSTVTTFDWDGKKLRQRWQVDSGHVPMTNPFNDSPHGRDGSNPEFATITTQGDHSLSLADVDDDGRQELVYGSATIDDDGSLLYSSFDVLPEGSSAPGTSVRLGHGDAMHVADIDPSRPGKEIWTAHEGATSAPYGSVLRDAATGESLFGAYSGRDTGRAMIGDVRPDVPGIEVWSSMPGGTEGSGLLIATGEVLQAETPGTNMSIRWAGDLTTQIVNGSGTQTPTIDDWTRGTLLTATGTLTNNGTKGNPSLVADVLGDWREELIVRTADSQALRFYTSTEPTEIALTTLMHDVQYRVETARQQTTYNQPAYTSFYLASDVDWTDVPVLATPVSPPAPTFTDRKGTKNDEVKVPKNVSGVTYYVNGEKVEARNGKVRVTGEVEVVAVPDPWFRIADGATSQWTETLTPR